MAAKRFSDIKFYLDDTNKKQEYNLNVENIYTYISLQLPCLVSTEFRKLQTQIINESTSYEIICHYALFSNELLQFLIYVYYKAFHIERK